MLHLNTLDWGGFQKNDTNVNVEIELFHDRENCVLTYNTYVKYIIYSNHDRDLEMIVMQFHVRVNKKIYTDVKYKGYIGKSGRNI